MPVTRFRARPEAERRHESLRTSSAAGSPYPGSAAPAAATDRTYRFYDLDHRGGITGASNRAFADDAEALAHADQLLSNRPAVEVWQTDRLVARLEQSQTA